MLLRPVLIAAPRDVRYWHKADVPKRQFHMSAFGASGHALRARAEGLRGANDPQPTKAPLKSRSAVDLPQCYLPLRSMGEIAGETARIHYAPGRRYGCVAARGARATAGTDGSRHELTK
jgi:hypothetical protein